MKRPSRAEAERQKILELPGPDVEARAARRLFGTGSGAKEEGR